MDLVLINIGDKQYKCQVAKSEEDQIKGLMHVKYLPPDEGMLFEYPKEKTVEMWMKNTEIPLDQIGINGDDEVTMVYHALPNNETKIPFEKVKYILEVNANSGIQVGDDFDIDDSEDLNKYVMKVIGSDGGTQFFLQGGERIVSRKETKTLIKKAKKVDSLQENQEEFNRACKSLGKYMFKILYGQNHRDPEYVESPK